MNDNQQGSNILLGLYWSPRGESLEESVDSVCSFIEILPQLFPDSFERIFLWGESDATSRWHDEDRGGLKTFVRSRMLAYAYKGIKDPGDNCSYGPTDIGYRMGVSNINTDYSDPQYMGVQMNVGAAQVSRVPDSILITGTRKFHPELAALKIVRRVFETAIATWRPDFGVVTMREFEDQVYSFEDMQAGARNIGAINYFSDMSLATKLASMTTIRKLGDGIMIQIVDDWEELQQHYVIERARRVRDLLKSITS